MRGHDELAGRLRAEWSGQVAHVRKENVNLAKRVSVEGVTFTLDHEQRRLRITIGERRALFYTQRINHVLVDLDTGTDTIVGITIEDVDEYVRSGGAAKPFTGLLISLLPALRILKEIQIPGDSPGSEEVARDLTELVAA